MKQLMRLAMVVAMVVTNVAGAPPARAADDFWSSRHAYLGETPPGDTPRVFAPGRLVEQGTFTMGRVAFSRDGKEFYYTQSDSWNSGEHAKLLMMRFTGHGWTASAPVGLEFMSPTLSIDGQTLYMRKGNMKNVWRARRTSTGWSAPEPFLEAAIGVYDFMPTASGNLYVGSEPDTDDRKRGITYAYSLLTVSGKDVSTHSLGRPLNEPGFNGDFFIAPDESYMIVSAKETKDYESELYISFRNSDRSWSQPVSLGARINDGRAHRWGQYVTADGKYLFYSWGTSEKDCAVRWVRFDALLRSLRASRP